MTEQEEYEAAITENQKLKDRLFDELEDKTQDLKNFKAGLLTKCGWVHSCNCPGSFWLWIKTIKGETISTDAEKALLIEQNIIEYK